jgi:hypothetical protein
MRQLVNQLCARCEHKISSIIDGRFCGTCGHPVHTDCISPDSAAGIPNRCSDCGSDLLRAKERERREEEIRTLGRTPDPSPLEPLVRTVRVFRAIWFFIGGVVVCIIGLAIIFSRDMRTRPDHFSIEDAAPGIAAVAAGIGMCALAVWVMKRR